MKTFVCWILKPISEIYFTLISISIEKIKKNALISILKMKEIKTDSQEKNVITKCDIEKSAADEHANLFINMMRLFWFSLIMCPD